MYFFKNRSLDKHGGAHCNSSPETEDHKFKSLLYCIVKSHLKEKKKTTLGLVLSSYFIFIRRRAEEINQWLKILLHKQENRSRVTTLRWAAIGVGDSWGSKSSSRAWPLVEPRAIICTAQTVLDGWNRKEDTKLGVGSKSGRNWRRVGLNMVKINCIKF